MRDRLMLEESEKMCEYCCNFDKEHIHPDCTALCKLTMTLAYAEDYGGNCMFYNVPKEQIIVPPCKVGDTVYFVELDEDCKYYVDKGRVYAISQNENTLWLSVRYLSGLRYDHTSDDFGKTVFLTREEAESALKKE